MSVEETVASEVGQTLREAGADVVFGVVGSGNFHVTNALVGAGARFVAALAGVGEVARWRGWRRHGGAAARAGAGSAGNVGCIAG